MSQQGAASQWTQVGRALAGRSIDRNGERMMNSKRGMVVVGVVAVVLALSADLRVAEADDDAKLVYFNAFWRDADPEWSNTSRDKTPSGNRFLGQFGNETVSLTVDLRRCGKDDASTSTIRVSFDLYIIGSWDGTTGSPAPDIWELRVAGGPTLCRTTFLTQGDAKQAYPGTFGADPEPLNPANEGADEVGTLGYALDAVYRLEYTFEHTGDDLELHFTGTGLQDILDESWGLDNVRVERLESDDDRGRRLRRIRDRLRRRLDRRPVWWWLW
jgi:hypothetical protein